MYRIQPRVPYKDTGKYAKMDILFVFDEILINNMVNPTGELNTYSKNLPPLTVRGFRRGFMKSMFGGGGEKKPHQQMPFQWGQIGKVEPPWAPGKSCLPEEIRAYKDAVKSVKHMKAPPCDGTGKKPDLDWKKIEEEDAPYLSDQSIYKGKYENAYFFWYDEVRCAYSENERQWYHYYIELKKGDDPIKVPVPRGIRVNRKRKTTPVITRRPVMFPGARPMMPMYRAPVTQP